MGISNFLSPVSAHAGRPIDLVDYPGLRIAIDISTWIHKVCMKFSEHLGDERHLSKFGRNELVFGENADKTKPDVEAYVVKCSEEVVKRIETFQKATQSHVLIVLDGTTPPIKKTVVNVRRQTTMDHQTERDKPVDVFTNSPNNERRIVGNKRTGAGEHYPAVVHTTLALLKRASIPFLVAPYEADTQLAFLQLKKYVDLVISEDSDLIAYGLHTPVLFKNSVNPQDAFTRGILLRKQDLGAKLFGKGPKFDLTHVRDCELAACFCAAGCDYCASLRGIGSSMACKQTRSAFRQEKNNETTQPIVERLLKSLLDITWDRDLTIEQKDAYKDQFLKALLTFRQGLVYDPVQKECRSLHEMDDPLLLAYQPYQEMANSATTREQVLGKVFPPAIATAIAQGWVNPKLLEPRFENTPVDVLEALQEYCKDLPPPPRPWTGPVLPIPGAHSTTVGDTNMNDDAVESPDEEEDEDMPEPEFPETQDL